MSDLTARDALLDQIACVGRKTRAQDALSAAGRETVFAVFEVSTPRHSMETFLGLVTREEAARRPEHPFSELIPRQRVLPVAGQTPLDELIWRLSEEQIEAIPVADEEGHFLGAVTRSSLLPALLRDNSDLHEKLRQYRKSVLKDRKRRTEWASRQGQINRAVRKLIELLARPAGQELFQRGIETLSTLVEAQYGAVVLLDPQGQPRESIMAGMTPGGTSSARTFLQQRKSLIDHVIATQTPLVLDNVPQHLNASGFPLGHPTLHSFLGVPIVQEEQCFGCIYLCDRGGGDPFADDDEMLAASFAQTLALVLSRARERQERRRAEEEREILSELGLRLSGADTLEKIAETMSGAVEKLWPWNTFALFLHRPGRSAFYSVVRLPAAEGEKERLEAQELRIAELAFGPKLLSGQSVLLGASAPGLPGILYIPIRMEEQVEAIIVLECAAGIVDRDREFLPRLADAVGPALARCQAERRNAAFLSLAYKLTTITTPHEAAVVIVDTADELLGLDSCSITLYYPELDVGASILHLDVVDGSRAEVFGPYPITKPSEIARRTMEQGPFLLLRAELPDESPGFQRFGDVGQPSASLMFVPLRIGTHVVGVFTIQSYSRNAYSEKDLGLLQALADLCAGALDRTRVELPLPAPQSAAPPEARPKKRAAATGKARKQSS